MFVLEKEYTVWDVLAQNEAHSLWQFRQDLMITAHYQRKNQRSLIQSNQEQAKKKHLEQKSSWQGKLIRGLSGNQQRQRHSKKQ
jgi:hypothetical protein